MTKGCFFPRNGHIHSFQLQPGFQRSCLQTVGGSFQSGLKAGLYLIDQLPHNGALFGRKGPHLLEKSGQFTFFAQIFDPQGIQVCRGLDVFQRGQCLGFDFF